MIRATKHLLIIYLVIFFSVSAVADLSQSQQKLIDEAVTEEMKEQGIVGAAIGVIQDNKIVYTAGYGYADREKKIKVDSKTVFNWASNSKPLGAYIAMSLVKDKKLKLDEDIRTYLPEWPERNQKITLRHLLSHRSGIPHYTNGKIVGDFKKGYQFTDDPVNNIKYFCKSPLLFTPGDQYSYSSYAYILASAVIQKAGKKPFDDLVKEYVSEPLKLTSLQLDAQYTNQKKWSMGYRQSESGQIDACNDIPHFWKFAAGGYKSNIEDFAKWALHLNRKELLPAQSYKEMWSLNPADKKRKGGMALGFFISESPSLNVSHYGRQPECTTQMTLYPTEKHGVVVLTNCGYGDPGSISTVIYNALEKAKK